MTTRMMSLKRLAAAVGVFALAASGVIMGGSAATAEVAGGPGQEGAPSVGTLTVHKRVGTQTVAHNGTEITGHVHGDPLPGVEFTVQRIGMWVSGTCVAIDLKTSAGWDAVAGTLGANPGPPVSPATEGELCASGPSTSQVTAAVTGSTKFDLGLGLYYVTEGDATPDPGIIEKAVPFYVTVPFPSTTGSGETSSTQWLYDVHVYPKNAIAGQPTKTVNSRPTALTVGSAITWTISQEIPELTGTGSVFTEASISDTLDSRLSFVSGVVKIGTATLEVKDAPNETGHVMLTQTGNALTWELTEDGLALLKTNPGEFLTVDVTTTVESVTSELEGETAGIINNNATVSLNGKPDTTTDAFTYWGDLVVTKSDVSTGIPLQGATFEVYEKTENVACLAEAPDPGTPVATGTSGTDGVVAWGAGEESQQGLWIANSKTELDPATKAYCLYETVVPVGYVANPAGKLITISTDDAAVATYDIPNTPVGGPDLPLTGSSGTLMLTVLGLGLVGLGAGGVAVRRNRASKQH